MSHDTDLLCVTKLCRTCAGCRNRKGRSFTFRGKVVQCEGGAQVYSLTVQSKGCHSGAAAKYVGKPEAASVVQRKWVREACDQIATELSVGDVTAGAVVEELESQDKPTPGESSVRGLVRRWKTEKQRNMMLPAEDEEGPTTWTADFDKLVKELRDDPVLSIRDSTVGAALSSFTLVVVAMFTFLSELHVAGALSGYLVGQCDHTFNLEHQGYKFGILGHLGE